MIKLFLKKKNELNTLNKKNKYDKLTYCIKRENKIPVVLIVQQFLQER